jgi:hypothetical protein
MEENMPKKTCKGEHSGHICVLAINDKYLVKKPLHSCLSADSDDEDERNRKHQFFTEVEVNACPY